MKTILRRFPFLSKIFLAFVLGLAALVLGGLVYKVFPFLRYFFVTEGLLVLATWALYKTDGQNLSVLGLRPSAKNIGYLFFGLLVGESALLAVTWLRTLYTGEVWHLSSSVNATAMAKSFYYVLPGVLAQELMFRGYLFTKTINRSGVANANMIFAFVFMLVHVLDRDVLKNPAQLIMLAICIPIGHLWFATALLRSKTLFFPIGLHWGNNWAAMHLTGTTDSHNTFFYLTHQKLLTTWPPFLVTILIFNIFFLLVTWATWKIAWPAAARNAG